MAHGSCLYVCNLYVTVLMTQHPCPNPVRCAAGGAAGDAAAGGAAGGDGYGPYECLVGMPCGNHNYVLLCCGIHVCFSVSMFCDFLHLVIVCCLRFSVWLLVCFMFSSCCS